MQFHVTNSPFDLEQVGLLNRLLPSLTGEQRLWLSGYLAACGSHPIAELAETALQAAPGMITMPAVENAARATALEVTLLYGSQTGNAERLARSMGRRLAERDWVVTISSMSDFKSKELKKLKNLLVLVSTHGEGIPPDNALPFYEFLHSRKAPRLEGLSFAVLALGDRLYEFFCQTGKDFDSRLEELGATRICPRVDCDVDYDEPAAAWFEQVSAVWGANSGQPMGYPTVHPTGDPSGSRSATAGQTPTGSHLNGTAVYEEPAYSRSRPFHATVLENLNLNGRGSELETRHLELSLEGSDLQYEPGDSLGIYPQNDAALIDELIDTMGWSAELPVPARHGEVRPLKEALLHDYEVTVLTKPLLEQIADLASCGPLQQLVKPGNEADLKPYIHGRDLLDLVRDYTLSGIEAQSVVSLLRKLPPRLYSIASSCQANPDEVHLTIRTVRYHAHGRDRHGVCSVQCASRIEPGDTLPVYVHHNPNFKLPADPDAPIILIGPGTGVAPFRAFLEEREETGAMGKAWLFYGDRHFLTDFLYQTDWQRWLKEGVLTKMDVAFSRDTAQKVYVQHRLQEHSRELYRWIEDGAHVYVCGDEKRMAGDVHAVLTAILEQEGRMSADEAKQYLTELQRQKRYQRDVY